MIFLKGIMDTRLFLTIFLFCFVFYLSEGFPRKNYGVTPSKDCGSTSTKISVSVEGCSEAPCVLKKGSNVSIAIAFNAGMDYQTVTAVVHGVIAGVNVPFPIKNPNGCKDCGLTCPLKKGQTDTYKYILPVLSSYPSLQLVVKWELQYDKDKDIACVEIPVQIK